MESEREQTALLRDDEGDRQMLERIFREHYRELVGFAYRYVESSSIAEDVVQDVFLALWRNRNAMADGSRIRAYLYRATYHKCLNALRHHRIERELSQPSRDESREIAADARLIAEETAIAVRRAVDRLPERSRLMFRLSREEGLTYAEIAQVAGVSIKTVETQMGRALRSLREQLEPYRG